MNRQIDNIIKKISSVPDVFESATFEEMKRSLIDWLSSQHEFKDVNFLGARINVLMDVLAYSMLFIQQMSNSALYESFIKTAVLRSSVVQHAQDEGYFVSGKKCAYIDIGLKCTHHQNPTSIKIPKNTKFLGKPSLRPTTTQPFITLEDTIVVRDKDGFYYPNLKIYQGRLMRTEFKYNPNSRIILYPKDIDRDKVRLWVDGIEWQDWSRNSMVGISGTSTIFYMREDIDGNTEISFGEGEKTISVAGGALESNYIGGLKPIGGATIVIEYLRTNGSGGNSSIDFSYADTLQDIIVHAIDENLHNDHNYVGASGGGDEESIERIRENAQLKREAQGRCVTDTDYEVFVAEKFGPIVQSIKAFTDMQKPGYAFIAIKPKDGLYLSTVQKDDIRNYLKEFNISSITPAPISPDYLFLKHDINVAYNINTASGSEQWLKGKIIEQIDEYYDSDVESFSKSFHVSKLLSFIDRADISVLGSSATITMVREIANYYATTMAGIKYYNKIINGSVVSSPIEFNKDPLNNNPENIYNVYLVSTKKDKDNNGKMLLGPFKPGDVDKAVKPYTGTDFTKPNSSALNTNTLYYEVGTIQYEDDKITWSFELLGLNHDSFLEPSIELYAKPMEDNIFVKNESLIVFENDLRPNYTNITMEAMTQ